MGLAVLFQQFAEVVGDKLFGDIRQMVDTLAVSLRFAFDFCPVFWLNREGNFGYIRHFVVELGVDPGDKIVDKTDDCTDLLWCIIFRSLSPFLAGEPDSPLFIFVLRVAAL